VRGSFPGTEVGSGATIFSAGGRHDLVPRVTRLTGRGTYYRSPGLPGRAQVRVVRIDSAPLFGFGAYGVPQPQVFDLSTANGRRGQNRENDAAV
jgi:hypothetical protein